MKTHYTPAILIGSATPICNSHIQGYENNTTRKEDVTCKHCIKQIKLLDKLTLKLSKIRY